MAGGALEVGPINEFFAFAIAHEQQDQGVTSSELASRAGITRTRAWQLVTGRRPMTLDEAWRLCLALNLDFIHILGGVENLARYFLVDDETQSVDFSLWADPVRRGVISEALEMMHATMEPEPDGDD
ncbi:helix-turn-helix domain-containing protein [Actinomyces urogenitalis]|uniref:helix-turn-helix domain-containing protein n=1 Tax=Actinomyces urogenitalis TaxID=103621 RepID=UPI0025515CB8|nr:helix-turn-helix transcriptional regulator [Actinomyces urogenitalis]MDK8237925.1 helix-turn-helix transcriptional regulator [Actinomyces urogenitalis]WOO94336.1 helix-turn-helix transcriptional regulator [Actinomyces urogenitalis]